MSLVFSFGLLDFSLFFRFGFLWIWISFSSLDTGFVNPFVLTQRWSVKGAKGNLFDKGKGSSDEGKEGSVKGMGIRNLVLGIRNHRLW